jgi:hypothetical protein
MSIVAGSAGRLALGTDTAVSVAGKRHGVPPSVAAVGVGVSIPSRCVADAS